MRSIVATLGVYGASKLDGGRAVRTAGVRVATVRTAWAVAAQCENFIKTMLRLTTDRDQWRVVADQHGSPTPSPTSSRH